MLFSHALSIAEHFMNDMNPNRWDGIGQRPSSFDTRIWEEPNVFYDSRSIEIVFDENNDNWRTYIDLVSGCESLDMITCDSINNVYQLAGCIMKMMNRLRNCTSTAVFVIIDNWTKKYVETLSYSEAIAKYGNCEVVCENVSGGNYPNWKTDVWVDIPGMHLGYLNSERITIPGGTSDEATFMSKETGDLVTVTKLGDDDYQARWCNIDNIDNETAGYSVRGTMKEIVEEIKGEI